MASSSNLKPIFLGWDKPLLPRAAEWLWRGYPASDRWDLSSLIIVLPGRRAVRHFGAILHAVAGEHDVELSPPTIITTGGLPERLYQSELTVAGELEQTLAWARVLRSTAPQTLMPLVAAPPPLSPIAPWLELAGAVRRLHEELASEHYRFGDIADHLSIETPREADRWHLLESLSEKYYQTLQSAGRIDPHAQRRGAAEAGQCEAPGDVIVIGAVDLNKSIRTMIDAVAARVTILVGAPESEAACFDDHGCVQPKSWMHKNLDIKEEHLIPAIDAEDQALAAGLQLSQWGSQFEIDQITVGITDEAMIAHVTEQLAAGGLDVRAELGDPLMRSAPARLISLIVDYLQSRTFGTLSSLVRHADLYRMLSSQLGQTTASAKPDATTADASHWLVCLDRIRSEHFPPRTTDPLPEAAADRDTIGRVIELVERWLQPLLDKDSSDDARLSDWCAAMRRILAAVYDSPPAALRPEWQERLNESLSAIEAVIERLGSVPRDLEVTLPSGTIAEMLLAQLADVRLHQPASTDKIELVGWLDLALDTSPALCVVGLNEPFVPESIVADPFLPGGLRHRLQIADNDQRFARDAYALSVMLHSRRAVRLIVGRSSADGSPTPPSRLLAACTPKTAAARTRRLLDELPPRPLFPAIGTTDQAASNLPIPVPGDYRPPTILSVTAFGDYLRCPYRFYLRHIAKLRPLNDAVVELAANQFGNLIHDSLEHFGQSGPKHSTNAAEVEACLLDTAADLARQRYGEHPSAPVRLQIAGAIDRLRIVARRQVQRTQQGWLLWAAEKQVDVQHGAYLMVDGERFGLKGRIDRIDYNEDLKSWAVIDYKTHSHDPFKKHYKKSTAEWIDLQLPLYRHMLHALGIESDGTQVELGYFYIGEKEADIQVNAAPFMPEHFLSADAAAADVVRGVRAGRFDMNPAAATGYDDYAVICQTGIIEHLFADEEEDALEETGA